MIQLFGKLISKDPNFYRTVAGIAIPIGLQGLITTGINMMDTIMIGTLGETELSAVSLANQFINIYQILCMGIGMGASVLVSRYYGMKDKVSMQKTVAIMTRFCLVIASVFALLTCLFPGAIMRIYTVEDVIIQNGERYLSWSVVTYFLLGLSLTGTIVLRNVGQVKIPLFTSIGAFFVNILANYFEFSVIDGFLWFREKSIEFRLKNFFMPVGELWGEYIRISIPVLISDGILALGNSSVAMVVGRLGKSFVAANAVTAVTQQLSSVLIQGVSQAGAIITGHTLGEGDREKAQEQGYALLGLGFLFGLVSSVIIMIISGPVIHAYHLSEETSKLAEELMGAISIIVCFQATNSIMTKGTLRGGGDTKVLMVADNICLWLFSLPLGILAGFVLHLPAFWIYICLKIDQIMKCIWCFFRLRSGKWIKKIKSYS